MSVSETKMNINRLDHLNFSVRDFLESADWYSRVFGFEKVEEAVTDGVRWGVLRAGETMLCLYEHPEYEHMDRFQAAERGLHHFAHFALRVTNARQFLETAQRESVEILYDGRIRWPHSNSWYVKDPTGYEIEVVAWDQEQIEFDPIRSI